MLTKILWILLAFTSTLSAQGVTTSSIGGSVRDEQGQPLLGATVRAIHVPSGTIYGAITNDNGRFLIQGV
ncbi:MAG: carboxypeptidase regulatory-like domain-containing protein, partial [Saprospiraceae bacterium]|nr:carboxypeptidase regulatory-like domain-containing protein [Saprospiraceae bacterium]